MKDLLKVYLVLLLWYVIGIICVFTLLADYFILTSK